jgi:hypothetical protein
MLTESAYNEIIMSAAYPADLQLIAHDRNMLIIRDA